GAAGRVLPRPHARARARPAHRRGDPAPRRLRVLRPDRLEDQAREVRAPPRGARHRRRAPRPPRLPDRHRRHRRQGARGDRGGGRPIGGEPGDDPAGTIALRRPGAALAVYRSRPTPVRLEAAAFESYLRDEGLDAVIAWRAANGESGAPGVEIFSRNAKTVLA